jgi:hypothetical protein
MEQFKTLLKKEFLTHQKIILTPGVILVSLLLVFLVAGVIMYINNPTEYHNLTFGFNISPCANEEDPSFSVGAVVGTISEKTHLQYYIFGLYLPFMIFIAFMVFYIGLTTGMLNDDAKRKCALFHTCIPVSSLHRYSAKLVSILMYMMLTMVVVSILYALYYFFGSLSLSGFLQFMKFATIGMLQSSVLCFVQAISVFSLVWFCSALYVEKTLSKTASLFVSCYLVPLLISRIFDAQHIVLGFWKFIWRRFTVNVNTGFFSIDEASFESVRTEITGVIFSSHTLVNILVAMMMFALGYLILKRREV